MLEKSFSELVEESMSKKRIKYGELAEKANISKTSITDIIRKNHVPKIEIIEDICRVLDINLYEVKEYRVKRLIDNIIKSYALLEQIHIQNLEGIVEPLSDTIDSGIEIGSLDDKNIEKISSLNLNYFPKEAKKYVINVVREIRNLMQELNIDKK